MMEDMREESEERGVLKAKKTTAIKLFEMEIDIDKIAQAVEYCTDTVRQWIDAGMAVAK